MSIETATVAEIDAGGERENEEPRDWGRDNIPVRNWWHMLLYAWDLVELDGLFNAKWESAPDLRELLTRILVDLTNRQIRRGLRGDYVDRSEPLKTVRGSIDFNRTLSDLLLYKGQLHCEYQEYSLNVPRNQIVAETLQRQFREKFMGASNERISELKGHVGRLVRTLEEIDRVRLDRSFIMNEMHKLGPNEREYKLMLRVCEMLYRPTMPRDSKESEGEPFNSWIEDRQHRIYEKFAENFYRISLPRYGWRVDGQKQLRWNETEAEKDEETRLPIMKPDIVLTHKETGEIVVIDTKWYSSVVTDRFDKLTVHSNNLYQMYAYMASQDHKGKNERRSTGILLYAQTKKDDVDFRTRIDSHPFRVYTLDLNKDWLEIEADLVALIEATVTDA